MLGWMLQWSSFGQFAGPPLAAWAAARAGGWHVTWWVTGACAIVGPAVGGFFSAFASWRWIFFVSAPVGLLALVLVAVNLQERVERRVT